MKNEDLRSKREQLRREENRKYIFVAAEKIFAQKGYSRATMDDIAAEAQFSKATLYRYFQGKAEIFSDIVLNGFKEAHANFVAIKKKKKSAEEKTKELIRFILGYYKKRRNIARIFLMERSAMKKDFNLEIGDHMMPVDAKRQIPISYKRIIEEIFDTMCDIIQEGIDSGEFRKVDAKEACYILGAMLRGFHFKNPLRGKNYSIEESTALLHGFFLHGVKNDRLAPRIKSADERGTYSEGESL